MDKILVIEDDEPTREFIVEVLRNAEYEVSEAGDGVSGVETAKVCLPDLIVCDVLMPAMNGFEVLEALRQDPSTEGTPFLFATACGERDDVQHAMHLGANDYLVKPVTSKELLSSIGTRLDRHKRIRERYDQKLSELRACISQSLPHEMLTPLMGILGSAELLIEGVNSLPKHDLWAIARDIQSSGRRLHRIIENYILHASLELSASNPEEAEELRLENTQDASDVIREMSLAKAKIMRRESDLMLELEDGPVCMDRFYLKKVAEELIDNAFRFSSHRTPIRVVSGRADKHFMISIADRGRGMTNQQIADVGAFIQFDRKRHEQQGAGLGLALAKRITEMHGGRLSIQSTVGEGTTVEVVIPATKEIAESHLSRR